MPNALLLPKYEAKNYLLFPHFPWTGNNYNSPLRRFSTIKAFPSVAVQTKSTALCRTFVIHELCHGNPSSQLPLKASRGDPNENASGETQ